MTKGRDEGWAGTDRVSVERPALRVTHVHGDQRDVSTVRMVGLEFDGRAVVAHPSGRRVDLRKLDRLREITQITLSDTVAVSDSLGGEDAPHVILLPMQDLLRLHDEHVEAFRMTRHSPSRWTPARVSWADALLGAVRSMFGFARPQMSEEERWEKAARQIIRATQ